MQQSIPKLRNELKQNLKEELQRAESQGSYFSLMFEELPTYQNILDGTPRLTWIFKLNEPSEEAPKTEKSHLVPRAGVEPA